MRVKNCAWTIQSTRKKNSVPFDNRKFPPLNHPHQPPPPHSCCVKEACCLLYLWLVDWEEGFECNGGWYSHHAFPLCQLTCDRPT